MNDPQTSTSMCKVCVMEPVRTLTRTSRFDQILSDVRSFQQSDVWLFLDARFKKLVFLEDLDILLQMTDSTRRVWKSLAVDDYMLLRPSRSPRGSYKLRSPLIVPASSWLVSAS